MNKVKLVIIIVLSVLFITIKADVFTSNVSPYLSVTELKASNAKNIDAQVYGEPLVDSIHFDKQTSMLTFEITDGSNIIKVEHKGMVSNLQNSSEIVVIGKYNEGLLKADQILVKCPSKYQEIEEKGE